MGILTKQVVNFMRGFAIDEKLKIIFLIVGTWSSVA